MFRYQTWSIGLSKCNGKKIVHFTILLVECPYNSLFGSVPKVGLTSSRIPIDFVKNITTEE